MAAGDIINTLTYLNRATIKEVLDNVGLHMEAGLGKLDMLGLVENAVMDMGIDYFAGKCDEAVVRRLASWFGVVPTRKNVAEQIRCYSLSAFLQQMDICILINSLLLSSLPHPSLLALLLSVLSPFFL